MKLLFDHNLPPLLIRFVEATFPGSSHADLEGLRLASDAELWQFASKHGFTIFTKDADFHRMSLTYGHPPKVIWLCVGNCGNRQLVEIVQRHLLDTEEFGRSESASALVIR